MQNIHFITYETYREHILKPPKKVKQILSFHLIILIKHAVMAVNQILTKLMLLHVFV